MGLIALVVALLLEQIRPLGPRNPFHRQARALVDVARRRSMTGRDADAVIAWFAVIVATIVLVAALQWLAAAIGWFAVFVLHVALLYLTIGFRQFSHTLREIARALDRDQIERADQLFVRWTRSMTIGDPASRSWTEALAAHAPPLRTARCRATIIHALVVAHRELFGPVLAYLLVPGAIGPVVYRIVVLLADRWAMPIPSPEAAAAPFDAEPRPLADAPIPMHGVVAAQGRFLVDWVPLRMTAASFAIAGDFEDATYCWRSAMAAGAGRDSRAMLVAVGGGALGLDLADPVGDRYWAVDGATPFDWQGAEPDVPGVRSTLGLVWRAATLVFGLFALVALSGWLGG